MGVLAVKVKTESHYSENQDVMQCILVCAIEVVITLFVLCFVQQTQLIPWAPLTYFND